jgi:hypothetical protein
MLGIISSVADVRTKPKFRSDRDSQLVYGEEVSIIEKLEEYSYIKCPDGLKGYIKNTQIEEQNRKKYKLKTRFSGRKFNLPFGSYLNEKDIEKFKIPRKLISKIEDSFEPAKLSHNFLGVPYLWGGTSDFGFDCSGFTQRLFRFSNIEIPRNSAWQREDSKIVSDFSKAEEGDLIFFKGHVGIYLNNGKIIHANGHYMSVVYTNLFDRSDYSNFLMKIFEKIGRFEK